MDKQFLETNKSILDFYPNLNYQYSILNGNIYFDENTKEYHQNINLNLKIDEENRVDDILFRITEEYVNRPDKIAKKIYGSENLTWIILQQNKIMNPFELELGKVLKLPSLNIINEKIKNLRDDIKNATSY